MDLEQLDIPRHLGELLKTAREKMDMTVATAARHLNLKQSFIHALESGDYQVIDSMVYVKGYLRIYARLLQINIDQELTYLKAEAEHLQVPLVRRETVLDSRRSLHLSWFKSRKKAIAFVVIVLAVVLVVVFVSQYSATPKPVVKVAAVTNGSNTIQSLALPRAEDRKQKVEDRRQRTEDNE